MSFDKSSKVVNITPVLRPWFARLVRASHSWYYTDGIRDTQTNLLRKLLHSARHTAIGEKYQFGRISDYNSFKSTIPVCEYGDIRPMVERMINGERDVLWPGVCRNFAQSSGTSDGKSKYIPVTKDSLNINHYPGASYSIAFYLDSFKNSRLVGGKAFILGGSFANEIGGLPRGVKVGDLSANLIQNINPAVNLLRVPSKHTALMADWTKKLPALVEASLNENITNISGVPSWFLTVIKQVIEKAGASTIHDVWPNLEVFFHGGISFDPYREQYKAITEQSRMRYLENYNASEGFFAAQDSQDIRAMRLLLDIGCFFEFVPLNQVGDPFPESLGAWEVVAGETYALVITSCNGLWRYAIGDTVKIESAEPLRITIAGRTKCYINAFGEEVMVHNAEKAISATCQSTGALVRDYTAGPVYTTSQSRGRHRWLIEWEREPQSLQEFAIQLDKNLQAVNSDYQAKRSGDIFLDAPEIITAPKGTFDRWLALTGKLGGQRKVPRLSNSPELIDNILNNIS